MFNEINFFVSPKISGSKSTTQAPISVSPCKIASLLFVSFSLLCLPRLLCFEDFELFLSRDFLLPLLNFFTILFSLPLNFLSLVFLFALLFNFFVLLGDAIISTFSTMSPVKASYKLKALSIDDGFSSKITLSISKLSGISFVIGASVFGT